MQIWDLQTMLYHPAKVPSMSSTLSLDFSSAHCVIATLGKRRNIYVLWNSDPNQCIPEVDNILNNAIQTLKHEKSVKESLIDMKSKGKENTKSHFAVQNANLQDILHQIDVDLGDLLKLYR